jgi:hypothetical protein
MQVIARTATAAAGAVTAAQPLVNIVYGRTFKFDRVDWSRLERLEFTSPDVVNTMLVLDDITVDILGNFATISSTLPMQQASMMASNAAEVAVTVARRLPNVTLQGFDIPLMLPGAPLASRVAPVLFSPAGLLSAFDPGAYLESVYSAGAPSPAKNRGAARSEGVAATPAASRKMGTGKH